MGPTPITPQTGELFKQPLVEQINMRHPLVQLAGLIDWSALERALSESFTSKRGRPATRPRLIAGLLYLQHAFDLSDEDVVGLGGESLLAVLHRRDVFADRPTG